jgi:hypothetical protein
MTHLRFRVEVTQKVARSASGSSSETPMLLWFVFLRRLRGNRFMKKGAFAVKSANRAMSLSLRRWYNLKAIF